jgi:hypothetical protein
VIDSFIVLLDVDLMRQIAGLRSQDLPKVAVEPVDLGTIAGGQNKIVAFVCTVCLNTLVVIESKPASMSEVGLLIADPYDKKPVHFS